MLGWSINLFRVRGIQLSLHGSFLLLLSYVAWEGWRDGGGAEGLLWSLATLMAFFTCIVLHEFGHSFTAQRFGVGVRRILLMPIGGMAEFDAIPREPARELLITLAGPAVNFVIAGLLYLILPAVEDEMLTKYSLMTMGYQLFLGNLIMGCFNLLPAFPMDGGRILRALLATRLPYLGATFWAVRVGKIISGIFVITLLSVVGGILPHPVWLPGSPGLLAALFAFIYFAGDREYQAMKRREIEDAHWRAVLARVHATAAPPAEEPPLLTSG